MLLISVAGALLVLLLAADVFLTVFHPRGRGGPLNRRQNWLLWALFRALGRRREDPGPLLSLAGPVLVVATLCTWVLLLVGGFALIYYPSVENFLVSPGTLRAPWAEALYYSAYTAATLGFGDVVADSETLRLISALEALGGFALLSTSITYFLAIFRELIAMQSLASDVAGFFRCGAGHVMQFTREEGYEAAARWSELTAAALSHVLLAHFHYPALHFFRPENRAKAMPVQLGALLEFRRMVREDRSPAAATLARHPAFLALCDGIETYLGEVNRLFVTTDAQPDDGPPSDDEAERAHGRLLRYMVYA